MKENNKKSPKNIKKRIISNVFLSLQINFLSFLLFNFSILTTFHLIFIFPSCQSLRMSLEVLSVSTTPFFLKKKHKRLLAKATTNNALYGDRWWIVTTQSAYARSFRKYAKVLTRNQIQDWLITIIPEARPPME